MEVWEARPVPGATVYRRIECWCKKPTATQKGSGEWARILVTDLAHFVELKMHRIP